MTVPDGFLDKYLMRIWTIPKTLIAVASPLFLFLFPPHRVTLHRRDTGCCSFRQGRCLWGSTQHASSIIPFVGLAIDSWVGLSAREAFLQWEELGSPTGKPCMFLALPLFFSSLDGFDVRSFVCMVSCRAKGGAEEEPRSSVALE